MLFPSHTGEEFDPLVDSTLEVLEQKGIDESIVRRRRVRFRAGLEDSTQS